MNLVYAESLISILCLFFAYVVSITIAGAGQAYIAARCGDKTAQEEGFLSLNPAVHVDPVGAFALIFFHLGWGRQIPINPLRVSKKWHSVKLFLVYGAEALIAIVLAVISLVVLTFGFKKRAFLFAVEMFFSGNAPAKSLTATFPEISSLHVVLALLLVSVIFFNVFIATYSIVINTIKYVIARGFHKRHGYIEYAEYIVTFGPLLFLFFFARPLSALIMNSIMIVAYALGYYLQIL